MASDAVFADEASAAQQAKMLRDGGARDGEGAGDLSGGPVAVAEEVEHGATGGVGQRAEHRVGRMRNGTVSHNA